MYRGGTIGTAVAYRADYKLYTVVYKREKNGLEIRVDFELTNKLLPVPGQKIFELTPVLTETGIKLVRHDHKPTQHKYAPASVYTVLDSREGL